MQQMEYFLSNIMFLITLFILGSYLLLGIFSAITLRKYLRKNSYINYHSLVQSPLSPRISIIAPAFNESKTIIDNAEEEFKSTRDTLLFLKEQKDILLIRLKTMIDNQDGMLEDFLKDNFSEDLPINKR